MTGDAPSPGQGPGPADESRPAPPAAPLALYRRYRPASFAEVKGQDHVTEPLRQALRSGRVNHAYLFSGPRGCGKTSSARILARSLNCEQGPTPDPCGVCASCVALAPAGPGSIDVIEIDAASHGGVDDARDLRERAFYAPVSGRFKIYIIDEAHMVTREGFNALLKLVEEPPPHLKFVFATTEPEKVIATIRSRTHHYPFRLVPPAVLRELLEQILASEGTAYEPAVLPVVIRAGAGSVRDSLSVLDQLIAGSDESGLTYARAVALLGYTDDRLLDEVAQAFAARDGAAVFGAIDRVVQSGHDPRRFAADLLDRLRDLIVLAAVPDAISTGLLDVPADRADAMREQAEGFGQGGLTRAAEIISAGLVEMRGATSPRLLLELMCAQVLLPAPGSDDADLRSRLERLERRLDSGAVSAAPARTVQPAQPAPPSRSAPPAPADAAQSARSAQHQQPAQSAPASRSAAQPAPPAQPDSGSTSAMDAASSGLAGVSASDVSPALPPTAAGASEPPAPAAGQPDGPVDAELLRSRWPDILEAVRQERKVAWMLLVNATVQSLGDGALTIEFASEGAAKGFVNGGHDQLLAAALQSMFGISPKLKAAARTPGSGSALYSTAPATGGPGGAAGGAAGRGSTGGSGVASGAGAPSAASGASGAAGGTSSTATRRGRGASGGTGGASGSAGSRSGANGSARATDAGGTSDAADSGGTGDSGSAGGPRGSGSGNGSGRSDGQGHVSGGAATGGRGTSPDSTGGPATRPAGTAPQAAVGAPGSSAGTASAISSAPASSAPANAAPANAAPANAAPANAAPAWDGAPPPWEDPSGAWDDPRDEEAEAFGPPPGQGSGWTPGPGGRPGTSSGTPGQGAPGALRGMDLIERELGGRVIDGIGDI